MLNSFPELLDFGLIAPTILRIALAFVLANLGAAKLKYEKAAFIHSFEFLSTKGAPALTKMLGWTQIILGVMFFFGIYTQIAALVTVLITFCELIIEYAYEDILKRSLVFYLLIFAIALSLLFSGAGRFAFDLPL